MTIKPLPCSGTNDNICTDTDKAVLINKAKELFNIDVGISLTLERIEIDSLESLYPVGKL